MDVLKTIKENNNSNTKFTRAEIIDELYWSSLALMTNDEMENIVKPFLIGSETKEDYLAVQRLYSNPEGAYINFFENIIIELYKKNPYTFIQAVAQNSDEVMNVLYIFRNKAVFLEPESIKQSLISGTEDTEIKKMIRLFFGYYDSLCST